MALREGTEDEVLNGDMLLSSPALLRRRRVNVCLHASDGLSIEADGRTVESLSLADIIGARAVDGSGRSFVEVFAYPKKRPGCDGGDGSEELRRFARHVTVEIDPRGDGQENQPPVISAKEWASTIRGLLGISQDTRKMLVFVNPFGGKGRARETFEVTMRPMLEQAAIPFEVIITEHAGHARDTMANATNLATYRAVVAVGGDGMLAEVVDGVKLRSDSADVFRSLPLGIVCAGSGNGLCKSILAESKEAFSTLAATFVLIKGRARRLDLSRVTTPSKPEGHLSFLSMGWAIVSDVDIESERLRCLGSLRFTVGALQRIIFLRDYPGRLSYLPATETDGDLATAQRGAVPLSEALPDGWVTLEDRFVMVWICQTSHAAHDMNTSPNSTLDDGVFTILLLRHTISRVTLLSMFLAIEQGTHLSNPALEVVNAVAYRLEPLTPNGFYSLDGETIEYGPVHGTMEPGMARVLSIPR